ncbi:unnamed protein product [Pylaiella littoralis]
MAAMAETAPGIDSLFSLTDETREMVDEARARELVDAALGDRDPASITKARLSNKSYSVEAAKVIGAALEKMTSVTEVDFSDIIAGRPKEVGLEVLAAVCGGVRDREGLTLVDVSENAMGPDGVDACRPAIEGKEQLRALLMCNDGLSAAAMEAVRDILLVTSPTELRTLHFYNNMSGDLGAKALAQVLPQCPKLSDFRFSGTRSGREGSAAVVQALLECPATKAGLLERLDLADNTLGEEGGGVLAEALAFQPSLTYVNLSECDLGDEGATAVAEALIGTAPLVRELEFSYNELTAEGTAAVAACAARKAASLEYLGLEGNEMGSAGAKSVAKALVPAVAIRRVQLSTNEIGTSGALAVARSLQDKKDLQSLELNGNMVSAEGLSRLTRILESAGKLDTLGEMDDNDEDAEEEEEDEEEGGVVAEGSGAADVEAGAGASAVAEAGAAPKDDAEVDELAAALGATTV